MRHLIDGQNAITITLTLTLTLTHLHHSQQGYVCEKEVNKISVRRADEKDRRAFNCETGDGTSNEHGRRVVEHSCRVSRRPTAATF